MGTNPAEIRDWDDQDIQALMLILNARHRARAAWARKNKVHFSMAPEFRYAPFYLSKSDDE